MNDEDNMQQLKQDVADIRRALLGNEAYNEDGLVKRVSKLEAWRDSLTVKIAGVVGGAAVIFWLAGKFIH
jgi:hypothetical protein